MAATERKRQKKIRERVIARDGAICCYCEHPLSLGEITLDHLIPASLGGLFNFTNLTVACQPCNIRRQVSPFFQYIEQFHFSLAKLEKYEQLCFDNLRIRTLNLAKEQCINDFELPQKLIEQASSILQIETPSYPSTFDFHKYYKRNDIIQAFDQLIRQIEASHKKEITS